MYLQFANKILYIVVTIGGLFAYAIFLPKLSLTPMGSINPIDPFNTRFLFKNDGSFSVRNISVQSKIIYAKDSGNSSFTDTTFKSSINESKVLKSGKETTINISLNNFINGIKLPYTEAAIEIKIWYKWLWFIKQEEIFKYELTKFDNTQTLWTPTNK